jgi:hypothetical protein
MSVDPWIIGCGKCGAPAGKPCRTPSGLTLARDHSHALRLRVARTAAALEEAAPATVEGATSSDPLPTIRAILEDGTLKARVKLWLIADLIGAPLEGHGQRPWRTRRHVTRRLALLKGRRRRDLPPNAGGGS